MCHSNNSIFNTFYFKKILIFPFITQIFICHPRTKAIALCTHSLLPYATTIGPV